MPANSDTTSIHRDQSSPTYCDQIRYALSIERPQVLAHYHDPANLRSRKSTPSNSEIITHSNLDGGAILKRETATMATNGEMPSDEESGPESPGVQVTEGHDEAEEEPLEQPKSVLKKSEPLLDIKRPELPEQPDPKDLDVSTLTPLSPEIIARQATINIGTIGHVAHGKSTVVKAISGVQTVRFKNELERNITIKLGYANAKIYKCDNEECPRPTCYKSYKSEKEVDPPCERPGCRGRYRLVRHVSCV